MSMVRKKWVKPIWLSGDNTSGLNFRFLNKGELDIDTRNDNFEREEPLSLPPGQPLRVKEL